MDEAAKKNVLRFFTYGMYAVTLGDGAGGMHGFTANWLTQASFEPPMVVMAVEMDSRSIALLRAVPSFAVNVLETGRRELAGTLGRRSKNVPQKTQGIGWHVGATGCPVLDDALGYLECEAQIVGDCGDHVLVTGRVVEAHVEHPGVPLTMQETGFRYFG